jgi:AraC family transcriptional activator of pobA
MATKLPSFLRRPEVAPAVAAASAPIFRAPRPELIAPPEAADPALPPPPKPSIFKAKPPVLLRRPAAPPRIVEVPEPAPALRVVPLPRLTQGGRWRSEAMRSYGFPVLLWFTKGQGRITVAGVTRGFGSHNLVFLPAHTMHGFEATAPVFGSAVFFPRGTDLPLPATPRHLRFREASDQAELNQLIDVLQRELERGLPVADRAIQHHAGLLSVWLERKLLAQDVTETPETAARRLSTAYAALVERDFRANRTVSDFAAELGVTPTHLTRSCNAACGRSAHELLSDRIFFEARRLLRDTETPVKDIATGLGFTSAAYFTRAFQKATGLTPTDFRRAR